MLFWACVLLKGVVTSTYWESAPRVARAWDGLDFQAMVICFSDFLGRGLSVVDSMLADLLKSLVCELHGGNMFLWNPQDLRFSFPTITEYLSHLNCSELPLVVTFARLHKQKGHNWSLIFFREYTF